MSTTVSRPRSLTTPFLPAPSTRPFPASRRPWSLTARASAWVAVLLWALPFAGSAAVAVLAGDGQGELVLLAALSAVLLIPAGLVALVALRVLAGFGWRPRAAVLALAGSGCGVGAVGLLVLAGSLAVS
jgi:hypothetical protein